MNSINSSQEKNNTLPKLRISIKRKRDDIMRKTVKKKKKEIKFDISIGSNQMSKGEDINPRHKNLFNNDIFVVGDGHGGKGCKEIIDSNVDILIDIAFKCGTSEAMKRAIELCKLENSGAMLIIAKYNTSSINLSINLSLFSPFGKYVATSLLKASDIAVFSCISVQLKLSPLHSLSINSAAKGLLYSQPSTGS